jgi:hypothetical protein
MIPGQDGTANIRSIRLSYPMRRAGSRAVPQRLGEGPKTHSDPVIRKSNSLKAVKKCTPSYAPVQAASSNLHSTPDTTFGGAFIKR